MTTDSTSFASSTLPNIAPYDCFGDNGFLNSTLNENGSTFPVTNTFLQSTISTVVFDYITNCTKTESRNSSPRDSFENYDEYWVAFYLNKYYIYGIVAFGLPGNLAALVTLSRMQPITSSSVYMILLSSLDGSYLFIKILYFLFTTNNIRIFDFGCKSILFLGTLAMQFSNWTLIALTVERFLIVWFPLKVSQICTKKKAVVIIAIIAVILTGLNLHFLWTWYEAFHPRHKWVCIPKLQYGYFMQKIWFWIDGSAYGFVPFIVIAVFNILIIVGIQRSAKKQKEMLNRKTNDKMKQQHQITMMSITVSVLFLILTSPNCVLFIYQEYWNYQSSIRDTVIQYLVYQIVFVLSDLNHSINFYLYFLSGKKFRDKFKDTFHCLSLKRQSHRSSIRNTNATSVRDSRLSASASAKSNSSEICHITDNNDGTGVKATTVNESSLTLTDVCIRTNFDILNTKK